MKSSPLISIIVPVYNVQRYLPRCLDSILKQSFPSVEVICVNDGSTDESALILAEYEKKYRDNLRVIFQKNQGLSSARNRGIEAAKGQWLMFVDSDDYVAENFLTQLAKHIRPNLDLICWGAQAIAEDNELIPWLSIQNSHLRIRFKGKCKFGVKIASKTPVTVWNKLFRADIIRQHSILFPEKCLFEDNGFFWKYFPFCHTAYFIQDKYYFYTQRNDSIMGKLFRNELSSRANGAKVAQDIACFYISKGLFYRYESLLQKIFLSLFFMDFDHVTPENKPIVLEQGKAILATIPFVHQNTKLKAIATGNTKILTSYNQPSSWEKVFAIRKENGKKYLYLLGFKIGLNR